MNGSRIDFSMYAWEPESEAAAAASSYFVSETPTPPPAPPVRAPQGTNVVPELHESLLSRPVSEVLNSVAGDSVLSRPMSEVLSSARRTLRRKHDHPA